MKRIQVWFLIGLLLSSCSLWNKSKEEKNPFEGMTAEELYTEAQHLLDKSQYASAAKHLEAIENMYPFSDFSESSQMDLMYSYYENEDYPAAAATADRYIHLYPRSAHVDYAYYLKGLANFQQLRGNYTKYFSLDESWRDPGTQTQAYVDFGELIEKFPNSRYRANSLQHMIYIRNMLAQHELNVAKYYFNLKMYVAANERASYLVKTYPQAPCVQHALVIMYESNQALGLHEAAEEIKTVYQANYHTDLLALR